MRQVLIRTNTAELREHTEDVLYENWRSEKLVLLGAEWLPGGEERIFLPFSLVAGIIM